MVTTKVLFITLSEYGQANTMLATASEIIKRPQTELHFVSYPVLQPRVQRYAPEANFHPVSGRTCAEAWASRGMNGQTMQHEPGSRSREGYKKMGKLMLAYSDEEFITLVHEIKDIITKLDPDVIVVDICFTPAHDACSLLNRRRIVNHPTQTLDFLFMEQGLKAFWYYPAPLSDFPFPVSWRDTIPSLISNVLLIWYSLTLPENKAHFRARREHGLPGYSEWFSPYRKELDYICPSIAETDFPLTCPPNVRRCGPIVLEAAPVKDSDPELFEWLNKGDTIFVCLGSLAAYSEADIRGILGGLILGLPEQSQALWKIKGLQAWQKVIDTVFDEYRERNRNRFRIVEWVNPDPVSVLQHPNVKCSVHHGGANSFFEACYSGVPHIILAKWMDLYHNATKLEYTGLGIYGNRGVSPNVDAIEFGSAVKRIMGAGEEGIKFAKRAEYVGQLGRQAGGRSAAADYILEVAKKGKYLSTASRKV